MWKTYSYAELKGRIKVGDRVRAAKDKTNVCGQLENDGSNEYTITGAEERKFYINDCWHRYPSDSYLQLWIDQKTWQDLEHGDLIDCSWGIQMPGAHIRKTIDVLQHSALVSETSMYGVADKWHTFEEMEAKGWKIVQPKEDPKVTELTVKQCEEMLKKHGEIDGELKIIKES